MGYIHKPVASGIVINHLSKTCNAFAPVMDSGKGKNKEREKLYFQIQPSVKMLLQENKCWI
jgi:hypothetical protein